MDMHISEADMSCSAALSGGAESSAIIFQRGGLELLKDTAFIAQTNSPTSPHLNDASE